MTKRLLFVCAIVLTLSSVGFGQWYFDWDYGQSSNTVGSGVVVQGAVGFAIPLSPQEQIVSGFMGQRVSTGPGPGSASGTQGGYVSSTLINGTTTTSASVASTQSSFVTGNGGASTESTAFVFIWQGQW